MSVTASVALAVAERVERTGGPRAGLLAYRKLAENSSDAQLRGRALLAALRCGVALRDATALNDVTILWKSVEQGLVNHKARAPEGRAFVWDEPIATLCKEMVSAGLVGCAVGLAYVEKERHRTSRALYIYARCIDVANEDNRAIAEAFAETITRAAKEGAKRIELAARVRRAAVLARSWHTMSAAIEEAQKVDVTAVSGPAKLTIARVLLSSASRFVRASALGLLDDLVATEHGTRALAIAARFVDQAGDALTPLELDRLLAMFGRERVLTSAPRANEAMRALAAIVRASQEPQLSEALDLGARVEPALVPLQARASDILRGRFQAARDLGSAPREEAARRAFQLAAILDVATYIRDGSYPRAARVLRELIANALVMPREVLGVAHAALDASDEELRDVAARFFEARLGHVNLAAPPRGFVALGDSLASVGKVELAAVARRAAALAKEPGAVEALGVALAREGWTEARDGHRELAIAKLREAKALLDRR